jgi:serine/threonine protein phosphatase PrpC
MEDRAVCIPSLNRTLKATAPLMGAVTPSIVAEKHTPEYAFFAVYDGHSGSSTSETLSQAFHFRLAAGLGLVKATENDPDPTLHLPGGEASRPLSSSSSSSSPSSTAAIAFSASGEGATIADRLALIEKDVLINAALDFDLELQEDLKPGDPISGSTAIIALIRRSSSSSSSSSSSPSTISSTINDGSSNTTSPVVLTIGNVGDSRAVLSCSGRAIDLSIDHKCSRPDEKKRIEDAGGQVIRDRLHGVLAVSRAFGDAEHKMLQGQKMWGRTFKANPLSAEPEVITRTLMRTSKTNNTTSRSSAVVDEFIVLACDGVWDVMTSQQAINFVRRRLFVHRDVRRAASELVDKALRLSSIDNVSVVVIGFNIPLASPSGGGASSKSRPSSRK